MFVCSRAGGSSKPVYDRCVSSASRVSHVEVLSSGSQISSIPSASLTSVNPDAVATLAQLAMLLMFDRG